MSEKDRIISLNLMHNDMPIPFVIKKVEGIHSEAIGPEIDPPGYNYYSIIWTFTVVSKHISILPFSVIVSS